MTSGRVARATLLSKAEEHILRHGLLDLTLTGLAEGIGSNRRMLLYHFDSLDALVREAVGDILERRDLTRQMAAILHDEGSLVSRLDAVWAHLADPQQEAWHRIYFAQMGQAVEDPARYEAFLTQGRLGWPAMLAEVFQAAAVAEPDGAARAVSSLWTGLQIALLSGAERPALAEAHHRAVEALVGAF